MSFGYSVGDAVLLTGIAYKTVQNVRRACGKYHELTSQVKTSHVVLQRFERELSNPDSLLHKEDDHEELTPILEGSQKILRVLYIILQKYNTLSEQERSGRRLWQKIRFGNGEVEDVRDQIGQLSYYTQALSLYLNLHTVGSLGRVEKHMKESGGDLKDIRLAVNDIAAHLSASGSNQREGSILSTYSNDDESVWKEFRRELVKEGFRSSMIHKHKDLIKAYLYELGNRGLLDGEDPDTLQEEKDDSILDIEPDFQSEKGSPAATQPVKSSSLWDNHQRYSNYPEVSASEHRSLSVSSNMSEGPAESNDTDVAIRGNNGVGLELQTKQGENPPRPKMLTPIQVRIAVLKTGSTTVSFDRWRAIGICELYHKMYEPGMESLLWTSPLDVERKASFHQNLTDKILSNVVLELAKIRPGPKRLARDIHQTLQEIQRHLALLDGIFEVNTNQWLDTLQARFYKDIMGSLIPKLVRPGGVYHTKEMRKLAIRRISQDLIRLNDIPIHGTDIWFKLRKGELKVDMEMAISALLATQYDILWRWVDRHQDILSNDATEDRWRSIEVDEEKHIIFYPKRSHLRRRPAKYFKYSPTSKETGLMVAPRDESCMCCTLERSKFQLVKLECSHVVCKYCIQMLFALSTYDHEFMPPACCTEVPILLD